MKTKIPNSLFFGFFVVIVLLATGGFWMQISLQNPTQNVDIQPVSKPSAAEILLRTLPVILPEKTSITP